jgi:hypothetical protein
LVQTLHSAFLMVLLLQVPIEPQPTGDDRTAIKAEEKVSSPKDADLTRDMDKMAISVTRMSEMCEMMMRNEQKSLPYKLAAGISLGAVLAIALILFVVLEVQWIIYFGRLLKTQKRMP